VVMWHGMGDSCCATWSIGALQKQIQDALPGEPMLGLLSTS
jgi:palmitoyl-protein thioesterase